MRYYWKKQPKDVPCCGQLAVSVILKKNLKDTCELFGHSKGTSTKDLIKVLNGKEFKCDTKLRRTRPELSIAKVTIPNSGHWHWVVVHKDKIYDGANGTVTWEENWRITSYLEIKG